MSHPNLFPFFSLPRELRDLIYPHLLLPMKHIPLTNEIRVRVYNYPYPHLFRISRHFKHELEETLVELSSLGVHHAGFLGPGLDNASSELPLPLKGVGRILFDVEHLWKDDLAGGVEWNDVWIRGVLSSLHSSTSKALYVAIHIHLDHWTTAEDMESAILWSGIWVDRGEVSDLRIVRPGRGEKRGEKVVLSKWDRESRQFVRVGRDRVARKEENYVWLNTMRDV